MNSTNHHIASSSVDETVTSVEQLRQENFSLCNALQALKQENGLLNEVISTVGSTLRLDEVLRHLVDTVLRATCCNSAFMYLYDKGKERLVLASTNERYQHLVGKITLALGEGLVGWVALHHTPVFLTDQAMADPRFYYFPELEEEKFQSAITVPIIAKDLHLVGVIMLQAVAPHEFSEQDHKFLINTAALVGGAIENAQLYENTQRKLNILTSLSILSQTISSGLYLDDMLRSLATRTVQIMEVDLCVVMLMDQPRERDTESIRQARRLVVRATSPNLNEHANFRNIDVDRYALERLRDMEVSGDAFESFNPLQDAQYKSLISVPLIAGTEQLGLINCYSNKARRYTSEDQTLLTTIANQAAIAIKNSHLMDQLAQKNLVKGFFDDLMHDGADSEDSFRQKAHFLGCDLSRPHAVVMIEVSHIDERRYDLTSTTTRGVRMHPAASHDAGDTAQTQAMSLQTVYKRLYSVLRRRIHDSFPGSLFYEHENLLTCLVSLGRDTAGTRLKSWLHELAQQMSKEYAVDLSIGIGNTCQNSSDYRRGFAEANEALRMGQNLHAETKPSPLVTHFNDLGVYRYLYKIAHMDDLRDVYQDQVARIDTYDRRKGTELLPTLETYLECAGNLTKTSERLYVHRNTLIQRLERLQSLCDIDIQERGNWLTL
jgi:GAF domain-containing protein